MTNFEIEGKEYELKLTFESVNYLNKFSENKNPMEIVGRAMQGDLELFPHIIHSSLFHTKENIPYKKIEEEIANKITNEELDYAGIVSLGYEVIADSFFYRKTVQNLLRKHPEMKEEMETMLGQDN